MRQPARRTALRAAAGLAAAGALAGCGFHLSRPPQLRLRRIYLAGFKPQSDMAEELRRQILLSPGASLTDNATQAQVVIEALEDLRDRLVAVSTAFGQVRELTLRARLRFRAHTPGGSELIPETQIELTRDMSYTETDALAKNLEADQLFKDMQRDIASQVLRRLAALDGV